ncbi:Protein of unknown function [Pyronema omphalodes CBS 100304]|uniref:Uncharacterized protein n=1 Tax=Pyronema omphalodes (strain CBS 100304) TaxID=1076935 RepID=U4LLB9_PYROM|nr:Protein of unknown function [Pyronema omphalodes CBS 100304]
MHLLELTAPHTAARALSRETPFDNSFRRIRYSSRIDNSRNEAGGPEDNCVVYLHTSHGIRSEWSFRMGPAYQAL